MKTVFLKPVDGKEIRKPDTKMHLLQTGERVLLDKFWRRRLKDGDVEIIEEDAE